MSGANNQFPFNQPPQRYQSPYSAVQKFNSTQPYAYGMSNLNPEPMNPAPQQGMPPVYGSLMTPQLNPQMQQSPAAGGAMQMQSSYAEGGSVMPCYAQGGLAELAQMLQMHQQQHGGNGEDETMINATPGELRPHYKGGGFFKKVARAALPIAGAFLGGPIGAGLGGAIGGALNKKNPIKAGLGAFGIAALGQGLMGGPGAGIFGGKAGNMFNHGMYGDALYGGAKGFGLANLFGGGAGLGQGNLPGYLFKGGAGASGLGGIAGGLGLKDLLLPGALVAGMFAKKGVPADSMSPQEAMNAARVQYGADQQYKATLPSERVAKILSEDEANNPYAYSSNIYENSNPSVRYAAHGGGMNYLEGGTGGQDDKINAMLSDGEYVLSADVVSSLGDGNNKAGAKKLDKFMSTVRGHKTSKGGKGLPPKAKSLTAYMRGR